MFVAIRIFLASVLSFIRQRILKRRQPVPQDSFYDLWANSLNGEVVSFDRFRGKKLLIVNTASRCGFTDQYKDLQKLHAQYSPDVVVLGFPSNDFLWQEPGTNEQIAEFCEMNYGVSFQMFQKVSVTGRNMHPVYKWLAGKTGKVPSWNFCKYVVDENGSVSGPFDPRVKPFDDRIIKLISL